MTESLKKKWEERILSDALNRISAFTDSHKGSLAELLGACKWAMLAANDLDDVNKVDIINILASAIEKATSQDILTPPKPS